MDCVLLQLFAVYKVAVRCYNQIYISEFVKVFKKYVTNKLYSTLVFAFVTETEYGTNNIIKIHFMTNIRPISFNPTTAKRFEDREEMYVGIKL